MPGSLGSTEDRPMKIEGEELVDFVMEEGEAVLRESRSDVEDVSRYRSASNPLRLFATRGTFRLGRLVLTDRRLALVPYAEGSETETEVLQRSLHQALGEIGLRMPRPEVELSREVVEIHLGEILAVDPHQSMFRSHPLLVLRVLGAEHAFKLSPPESPLEWAEEIHRLSGCPVEGG
jgi:hypothetical protein